MSPFWVPFLKQVLWKQVRKSSLKWSKEAGKEISHGNHSLQPHNQQEEENYFDKEVCYYIRILFPGYRGKGKIPLCPQQHNMTHCLLPKKHHHNLTLMFFSSGLSSKTTLPRVLLKPNKTYSSFCVLGIANGLPKFSLSTLQFCYFQKNLIWAVK